MKSALATNPTYDTLSDSQKQAVQWLDNGDNVVVLGAAGTGKSHLIKFIEKRYENTVLCAPTGLASRNIGGVTLHSFFKIPFGLIDPQLELRVPKNSIEIIDSVELLIIDEIGMVRSDVFAYLDRVLRYVKRRPEEAFGGVQIILFGDLFQLGPVVTRREQEFFSKSWMTVPTETALYPSAWFFNTFSFEEADFKVMGLTEVFRQKDPEFVSALHGLRKGNMAGLDFINNKSQIRRAYRDNETVITSINATADDINQANLAKIHKPETRIKTEVLLSAVGGGSRCVSTSDPVKFKKTLEDSSVPASVTLKEGARVMVNKHESSAMNGLFGTVVKIHKGQTHCTIEVLLEGDQYPTTITQTEQPLYEYQLSKVTKKLAKAQVGVIRFIPLVLGWALTVHKIQGQTMNEAYIKNSDRFFCHGQAYVALSRVRNVENLTLERKMVPQDFIIDREVIDFLRKFIKPKTQAKAA